MTILRASLFSLCVLFVLLTSAMQAQTTNATVNGLVVDSSGAVLVGASVQAINDDTNVAYPTSTNSSGVYSLPNLPPGHYHIQVGKTGFKNLIKPDIILNVQDARAVNFTLQIGAASETVTVSAGISLVNTEDATVSTVVDRNFAENLPLNGRSFQTLVALSPGVVLTPANQFDSGQFSVNGQRGSSNYFTVDGVSANVGVQTATALSQTAAGTAAGFSVTGGTNNLVSEDALQEFRIQTSTFAPEFGRTPGAQVALVTRSGTSQFHGALFEYLRNDILDANDWFANLAGEPKAEERINDFGGVFGGAIFKNRTFFFVSYEGQRLRLPQIGVTTVPSIADRQSAPANVQPFLNAYPVPNSGTTGFNGSFSNQSTLNATSFRIDQKISDRLNLFGRYDYAPSDSVQRITALSNVTDNSVNTQTATVGANWSITPATNNDFRFNYSRVAGNSSGRLDSFGGAMVPSDSTLLISPFTAKDGFFTFGVTGLQRGGWSVGKIADNLQRQFNIVDNFMLQRGSHALKFGVDYRRLSPNFDPASYALSAIFGNVSDVIAGVPLFTDVQANRQGSVAFRNLGVFAQDTWRVLPRLTLTYGLRWDVDFAPASINGPELAALTGFKDLSTLALAPSGTPVFATKYDNFAPRLGLAYLLRQQSGSETVLRGGFGIFYDLATVQAGEALANGAFPFGVSQPSFGGPSFPFDPAAIQPPPITPASLATGFFTGFDPHLESPRVYQWNVAMEQALGEKQTISATYLGAIGRRLIQEEFVIAPNANIGSAELIRSSATSDYHSLQIQYLRRMSHGLQALTSYTFAHSIDTASSSSIGQNSNIFERGADPRLNRGPSDFDVRHSLSAALAYEIPALAKEPGFDALLSGWSVDNVFQVRTATPVDVFDSSFLAPNGSIADVRPDLVPGQPIYMTQCANPSGTPPAQIPCPGGRGFNPQAFVDPPIDPITFLPTRQGNLGRNALRGFGAWQWDFAVRREFKLHESWRLQFRSEFFNILNHPSFANPTGDLSNPAFGQSTSTLARGLSGNVSGTGGFAPIFQVGGPRSIQFALKLMF